MQPHQLFVKAAVDTLRLFHLVGNKALLHKPPKLNNLFRLTEVHLKEQELLSVRMFYRQQELLLVRQ